MHVPQATQCTLTEGLVLRNNDDDDYYYATNILGTAPLRFGTRAYIFGPPNARSHDQFFFIWGTTIFWGAPLEFLGTRAHKIFIYAIKTEGTVPKILATGAKL